ncbi:hypothetical protein G7Y89_g12535 [Cudoniella acicularis]|uniref:DRBM domain-containing protein n=1 Tax=Cudoniella acicularis TaxID=354080 RepID=A0A8H4RBC0_9HELO|nr:hypothetical protein G7Y89_g12535 [Cudoniella acicularis]
MSGFYIAYLQSLCIRKGWRDPLYETYRSSSGFTCLVIVNGREYVTDLAYESDGLAQENAAMRAYMVCRNFSVNGGMLVREGVSQGLLANEGSGRNVHRRRRGGRRRSISSWEESSDSDEFSVKSRADDGALSGGTDHHRPWRRVTTLPVHLGEVPVNATPDTGSDDNAVSAAFAEELGLQVDVSRNCLASFQLANGREIKSSGIASTTCTFRQGSNRQTSTTIVFHIFAQLAVPIIIGMKFLQATETLTKYSDRLAISLHQTPLVLPRILHLNRPQQRLRCYLGIDLAYANADTGAEMNLISPAFAAQRGLKVDKPDSGHQEVVLADGSRASISGKLRERFYTFDKPSKKFVSRLKAAEKDFYVLDGLTTDVLLGNDLLFEISAFSEHQNSFVDLGRLGIFSDLNLVAWLSRREKRLLNISNGQAPARGQPIGEASSLTLGDAAAALEVSFQIELDDDDAREQHLRQTADREIAQLDEPARSTRRSSEDNRRRLYDENRIRRVQEHDQRMAATTQQIRAAASVP